MPASASQKRPFLRLSNPPNFTSPRFLSTDTPYPLQYDMIVYRPVNPPSPASTRRRPPPPKSQSQESGPNSDMGFDEWLDKKLSSKDSENKEPVVMDKAKRKYYNKRRKRMYGEDSDSDGGGGGDDELIELKPDVVEFRTMFHREQELYFYDTFAYPWEKNKHYRMVYQLEKKFFPGQGFDKAFLQPGESNAVESKGEDDRRIVFFDEGDKEEKKDLNVNANANVREKKVEDFFESLKNEKNLDNAIAAQPVLSTRRSDLPPKWDGPNGTVVLVNKPKGINVLIKSQ